MDAFQFQQYLAKKAKPIKPVLAVAPVMEKGVLRGAAALAQAKARGYSSEETRAVYVASSAFGDSYDARPVGGGDKESPVVIAKGDDDIQLVWWANDELVYHTFVGWSAEELAALVRRSLPGFSVAA